MNGGPRREPARAGAEGARPAGRARQREDRKAIPITPTIFQVIRNADPRFFGMRPVLYPAHHLDVIVANVLVGLNPSGVISILWSLTYFNDNPYLQPWRRTHGKMHSASKGAHGRRRSGLSCV